MQAGQAAGQAAEHQVGTQRHCLPAQAYSIAGSECSASTGQLQPSNPTPAVSSKLLSRLPAHPQAPTSINDCSVAWLPACSPALPSTGSTHPHPYLDIHAESRQPIALGVLLGVLIQRHHHHILHACTQQRKSVSQATMVHQGVVGGSYKGTRDTWQGSTARAGRTSACRPRGGPAGTCWEQLAAACRLNALLCSHTTPMTSSLAPFMCAFQGRTPSSKNASDWPHVPPPRLHNPPTHLHAWHFQPTVAAYRLARHSLHC